MSAGPPARRPRLEDVAERAGVSKSIASRVLNGDPAVSVREATRARIAAAAHELAYRPHPLARALASGTPGALALLVPALDNAAYADVVRGAAARARARGSVLLVAEDGDADQADAAFTELVAGGRIDGLAIASELPAPTLLAALGRHWVPHVFVNRAIPGAAANVVMDERPASALALDHLHGLGHRRIGHVAGPAAVESARRREEGFREAAQGRGLAVAVARAALSAAGGAAATARLLGDDPAMTGLYASSFGQAVGALGTLARAGRAVPGDVSVIAFEDLALAEHTVPPLTAVAMPLRELGEAAVDALLDQLAGAPPAIRALPTQPRLVVRASTGPASRP